MKEIKSKKIEKALNLNCFDDKENKEKLRKIVSGFKWFKKFDFVDFATLENVYAKVRNKYGFCIQYVMSQCKNSQTKENYWSMSLKNEDGKWIYTVYGMDIEECLLKSFIVFYGVAFKGELFCLGDE